jgi:hypothetical protein
VKFNAEGLKEICDPEFREIYTKIFRFVLFFADVYASFESKNRQAVSPQANEIKGEGTTASGNFRGRSDRPLTPVP